MWQEDASISLTRCLPINHPRRLRNPTGESEVATTSTIAWWAQFVSIRSLNIIWPPLRECHIRIFSITRVATLHLQLSLSMCVCDEDRCNADCQSCDSVCQEDTTSSSEDTTSTPEGSGQSAAAYASPLAVSAVFLAMKIQWMYITYRYWFDIGIWVTRMLIRSNIQLINSIVCMKLCHDFIPIPAISTKSLSFEMKVILNEHWVVRQL